jgi:hypothetical protein
MSDQFITRPLPVLIPAILLVFYFWRCYRVHRWPDIDKCIEIIAYSSGLYAACILFPRCLTIEDIDQVRVAMFTGALVTCLASVRGAWIVLMSVVPLSQPVQIDNADQTSSNHNQ